MATSTNGFTFTAAIDAKGEQVTLVAHKDDHEGKKTEVFRLTPDEARALVGLVQANVDAAKNRRKAIRKATRKADAALLEQVAGSVVEE